MNILKLILLLTLALLLTGGIFYYLRYKPTLPSITNQEQIPTSLSKQEETSTSLPNLTINSKVIPAEEYQEVFDLVQKVLNDRDNSIARTNYLFIADELLKETAVKQGFLLKQPDPANLNKLQRLEQEIAYLKQGLLDQSLNWYSGEFYLMRFENPEINITIDQMRKRARAKIEEIRSKVLAGASFSQITSQYDQDTEIKTINYNQGYATTFSQLTMGNPTIKSPEVLQTIKGLKAGQISEIFEMSDPNRPGENKTKTFAFAFVKLTDYHQGVSDSFNDWLEQAKKRANIAVIDK